MTMEQHRFSTSSGPIALYLSEGKGRPVLFVHGNSLSAESFQPLFASDFGERYRLVAFDLPGHGASPRAEEPGTAYRLGTYSRILREVADAFCAEEPVIIGHSLGGHIAVQAIAAGLKPAGLMTIGTPPLSDVPSMARAFKNDPSVGALFTAEVSPEQAKAVARALWGVEAPAPPYLARTILATDPRARGTLGRSLSEDSLSSEVAAIAALSFTVAILLGERDGLVDADYVRALPIPNAWRALPLILQGSGHCPMLDAPGDFARLAREYIEGL